MTYYERMVKKVDELRKQDVVRILAIESSCDDTSVAIVTNGRIVNSNVISSQIDIHTRFGGVVPEIASRNHILAVTPLIDEALKQANMTFDDIDAIAVTQGAGLVGALLVGLTSAKALAYALDKPLIACNHIKGHIAGNYLTTLDLQPPFMCLIVSGGHTAIVKVEDYTRLHKIGSTIDDAIGEAFDKVARILGLGYPGGPKIDKIAREVSTPSIEFVKHSSLDNTFDVSYSGLKTAVINYVHNKKAKGEELNIPEICHSFQHEAVMMVVEKTVRATLQSGLDTIAIAGGVSANSYLREKLTQEANKHNIRVVMPKMQYCTDNAAMIGSIAYYEMLKNPPAELNISALSHIEIE